MKCLEHMPGRKIYFLLSNTFTILTRAIGIYTQAPYNHVSIAFDEDLDQMFSFGRLKPQNPFLGGFVHEGIDHGTFAYFKDTRCALYELNVTPEQYSRVREAVRQFEREQDKYSFNLIGFAGVAAGLPVNRRHAYFCSQFVSTVLERGGVKLFDKPPGLVTPPDFQNCAGVRLIYEGRLCDYRRRRATS